MGFLHNDIKLENIVVGHKDSERLYLIDFGLTYRFRNPDQTHIEKQKLNYFSGNFLFASISACRGRTKSRRDDLESAFYLLIYILNDGRLPWSNFGSKDVFQDFSFA